MSSASSAGPGKEKIVRGNGEFALGWAGCAETPGLWRKEDRQAAFERRVCQLHEREG